MDFRLLLCCCYLLVLTDSLPLKEGPSSPLSPVALSSSVDAKKKNPDVVAMLIDLDKIEAELKNPQLKTRTYDLDSADNSEVESDTKRLLKDVVAQRDLPLPLDHAQLDNNILAISLLRNRDKKKLGQRWNFSDEEEDEDDVGNDHDQIFEEGTDDIAKIVQIILHKGNGVSVTIQDGKSHNHLR